MSKAYFKGDVIFLYTQFTDTEGNPCSAEEPKVRILHDSDGNIYEDLPWTDMQTMTDTEYYLNFTIPYDADLGQYQAIYAGTVSGETAHVIETFHVVSKSEKYEDTVKVYGYVSDIRTGAKITDAVIQVINTETQEKVAQSLTDLEGYWEAYIYPGIYVFSFQKMDFQQMDISVEIGDEHSEVQFNNIGLEEEGASQQGNGIFQVGDKYVNKQGTPLVGLSVNIASILEPTKIVAVDTTNDDGQWQCYLDPGTYILRISGVAMGATVNKIFRIKVDETGSYKFEDISKNVAAVDKGVYVSPGDGSRTVTDSVKDRHGNPIIDVQVNAFKEGVQILEENVLARDYTDVQGKWTLKLNPGNYVIEFYHPDFKPMTEKRTVV